MVPVCSVAKCSTYFHSMCALRAGYLMEDLISVRDTFIPLFDFQGRKRVGSETVKITSSGGVIVDATYALHLRLRSLLDIRVAVVGGVHFSLLSKVQYDIGESCSLDYLIDSIFPQFRKHIEPDLHHAQIRINNSFVSSFREPIYKLKCKSEGTVLSARAIEVIHSTEHLNNLQAELEKEKKNLVDLQSKLENDLELEKKTTADLRASLEAEQKKSQDFQSQVQQLTSTLETEQGKAGELRSVVQKLTTAVAAEKKKSDELRTENKKFSSSILTWEKHCESWKRRYNFHKEHGSAKAVENFLKSHEFAEMAAKMNEPVAQLGYNQAIQVLQELHLPNKSLEELGFESDAADKVNAVFKELTRGELGISMKQFIPSTPVHEAAEVDLLQLEKENETK